MTNCKTCMKEMQEKLLQIARDGATGGAEAVRKLKPVVEAIHERIKEAQSNE